MVLTGAVIGLLLGFVMQRGRFCVTGFLRDIVTQRSFRGFIALLIVISVHAVGVAALTSSGVITPDYDPLSPIAVIVGGLLFGIGIVLAGGCASGTWYRSGEGLIGSWIALLFYGLSAAAMKTGVLADINQALRSVTVDITTIHGSLGMSVWPLAMGLAALTTVLAVRVLQREWASPQPVTLAPRKSGLAHILTEKPWHIYITALLVGILGVIAWPLSAASGRNDGLGITTPTANLMNLVVTGDTQRLDWGVLLVLGILLGSFIAAQASGEFRLRVPDATQAARSVVGGILMGVGAAWAGGCTVGNGMVQTSLFTYQGWIALLSMAVGVGIAARLFLQPAEASPVQEFSDATLFRDDAASRAEAVPVVSASYSTIPATESSDPNHSLAGLEELAKGFSSALVFLKERPVSAQKGTLVNLGDGRYELNTVGAVCPFPLIEARSAMRKIKVGEELVIPFDCTQATDSLPRWAAQEGHEVTRFERTGDAGWVISVRRGR